MRADGAALELSGVGKRFGDTIALEQIDLRLPERELMALVGPSGCGKSTLLRIAAGLLGTDTGTVRLAGALVDDGRNHVPPERRHVGLVFQEHALFPHLTVAKNIAFGIPQARRAAGRSRVDEVLELVGLPALRNRYPHELSGGERQRVALARALAPAPTLMLLDEPFASLDPNLRTQIRADVVAILRETHTPAVFVTHEQSEAMAIGDRVAVMRAGRIEQLGTPWELFHQPANAFVAAFMGEADFLPIDTSGGLATTELGPLVLDGAMPGGDVVAMVRPEHVTFVAAADSGADAEVVGAEFRGSSWCYTLKLASGATVRSLQPHHTRFAMGDRVRPALAEGHRHVVVERDRSERQSSPSANGEAPRPIRT